MTAANRIARRVVVRGRVQGVFFRESCRRQARDAGVDGWVENRSDGTVRAVFEGPASAVGELLEWMHRGPQGAVVTDVEVTESEPSNMSGFEVR